MKKISLLLTVALVLACSFAQAQVASGLADREIVSESRLRKSVIKLDSKKEKGSVLVTSHRAQDVQFYIFDLEGTILHQGTLRSKEKKQIDNLAKGTYTYTIFENDESVEEGQLVIK